MSDIAKLGFSVDTTGLKKGEKALDSFAKTGEKTEKRTDTSSKKIVDDFKGVEKAVGRTAAAQLKLDKATAQFSRRSGQAGIQFQQFIGQIQGGQGVMLALSQQSADLGFVLGAPLLGAIAGISASLIGLLIPSLLQTKDATQLLEGINKDLALSLSESTEGADILSKSLLKLADKSEALAKLQISSSIQDAEKLIKTSAEGIEQALDDAFGSTTESILRGFSEDVRDAAIRTTGSMQDIIDSLSKGSAAGLAFGSNAAGITDTVRLISDQFKITRKQAVELALSISDVFSEQSVFNIKTLESTLADLNVATGGTSKEISKLAKTLIPLFDATTDGVDKTNLLRQAFGDFSSKASEADEEVIKFNESVLTISTSLEAQIIALGQGKEAALEYGIAQKLNLDSVDKIPASIKKQIAELKSLNKFLEEEKEILKDIADDEKDAEKARKKQDRDFKKLTKDVENFGGAWSKTGSIVVDAFGDISDSITDYMKQLDTLDKQQSRIDEQRKQEGADQVALNKLEQEVNENKVLAELSGMKSLAKGVGSLFDEKTAASKAFAALNKIITVAEIALSFQKMAASTTEAGIHVANETTKQGANALTAITSAFAAPFPINFVAGAAMIGIMASLLGSVFGGGGGSFTDPTEGRQKAQGTGTVLGSDDKSQSILESQERFEDLQIDQLAALRGIKFSIDSLSLGIKKLAGTIVGIGIGDFGGQLGKKSTTSKVEELLLGGVIGQFAKALDPTGIVSKIFGSFSSTKKSIVDQGVSFVAQTLGEIIETGIVEVQAFFDIKTKKKSFFGLSSSTSLQTEFQNVDSAIQEQMGLIFGHIGDVVLQSAELLGFETVKVVQSSFDGIDFSFGDFNSVLQNILTGQFGEIFGGLPQTVELSLEEALAGFTIDIGKVSFEGLSGEEIEAELQAIFSQQADLIAEFLVPSIAEYQKVGEGLFDTLTRVSFEQTVFNNAIDRLGFDLSELSTVMKIDVAQSIIDLTGGFENFSDLSTSFFENFFTEAEQFAQLETSLTKAFDSLGLSLVTSKEEFRALTSGIDITTDEGKELFAALLQINPALSDFIEELERVESKRVDMTIELLKLQGEAEQALAMEREIELSAMDESLRALQSLIFAEEDRINLLQQQQQAVRSSFGMLEKSIALEKQRAQAALDVATIARDNEVDRINSLRGTLNTENELRMQNLDNTKAALNNSFNAQIGLIKTNASEEISVLRENAKTELDLVKSNLSTQTKFLKDNSSVERNLIKSNSNERIKSLNDERKAVNDTATAMRSLVGDISGSLGLDGSKDLVSALASASRGDFAQAQALDINALANLDPSQFSSAEEFAIQQAINRNRLATIGGLAGAELSESEVLLQAIDSQILATKEQSSAQVATIKFQSDSELIALKEASEAEILAINNLLDSQILAIEERSVLEVLELQNQLNSLLNIDTGILSIADAIVQFRDAQQELDVLNFDRELEKLDLMLVSADEVFALHEQGYTDELERLDAILADNEELLNAALGIDASVLSVADAIILLNDSIAELNDNTIPEAPIAVVTDERQTGGIKPTVESLVAENKKANEENLKIQMQILRNSNTSARALQQFKLDGIDTRPIV